MNQILETWSVLRCLTHLLHFEYLMLEINSGSCIVLDNFETITDELITYL
jgi:hypothetical protein